MEQLEKEFDRGLYIRIYGGLAWPTLLAPAYFCIFAQEREENPSGKRRLVQVHELEGKGSIDDFFREVRDTAESFDVEVIFADVENTSWFEKFTSKHYFLLQKVTGAQDFDYGLEIIKVFSNAHALQTMADSVLRSQLASLRGSDLKEAFERLNAINGLRYAVSGFDDREEGRYNPIDLHKCFA